MPFLIFAHFSNFLIALFVIIRHGGLRNNLPYAFVVFLYFIFTFYTPVCNYIIGNNVLYGNNYAAYYPKALLIYALGVLAFTAAYALAPLRRLRFRVDFDKVFPPSWYLDLFFYAFFAIILSNLACGGIRIWALFNPFDQSESQSIFGVAGYSYYLEAFTECLISVLILATAYRVNRLKLILWILLAGLYFVLSGWRYRLILVGLGLFFNWLLQRELNAPKLVQLAAVVLMAFVGIQFLTLNRQVLAHRQFDAINWNISDFDNRLFLNETNNSQTFMSVLKYMDKHQVGFDYGRTMFGYLFVRATPAFLFDNNQKPGLPPGLLLLKQSFESEEAMNKGPAVCNIGEYYIAFGIPGVIGFMSLFGALLKQFAQTNFKQPFGRAVYCIGSAYLFQFVTRGYLPQQVELFLYLSIPFVALFIIYDTSNLRKKEN